MGVLLYVFFFLDIFSMNDVGLEFCIGVVRVYIYGDDAASASASVATSFPYTYPFVRVGAR